MPNPSSMRSTSKTLSAQVERLAGLVESALGEEAKEVRFTDALARLEEAAAGKEDAGRSLSVLGSVNPSLTFFAVIHGDEA